MRDSTFLIVYNTMDLTRSHEAQTNILSVNSELKCRDKWPELELTWPNPSSTFRIEH